MKITYGYTGSSEDCTVGTLKNALSSMPDDLGVIGTVYAVTRDDVEETRDGMLDIVGVELVCDDPDEGLCKLALYAKGALR